MLEVTVQFLNDFVSARQFGCLPPTYPTLAISPPTLGHNTPQALMDHNELPQMIPNLNSEQNLRNSSQPAVPGNGALFQTSVAPENSRAVDDLDCSRMSNLDCSRMSNLDCSRMSNLDCSRMSNCSQTFMNSDDETRCINGNSNGLSVSMTSCFHEDDSSNSNISRDSSAGSILSSSFLTSSQKEDPNCPDENSKSKLVWRPF